MSAPAPFHLVRLWLDGQSLVQLERMMHLPHSSDDAYLVHALCAKLFGAQAPKPFVIEAQEARFVRVLGYSDVDAAALAELARGFADPTLHAACDWSRLCSKPMPTVFERGQRLGFRVQICPTVRLAAKDRPFAKGSEVDAFVAKAWAVADPKVPLSREQVYAEWLTAQFDRRGGATLVSAQMQHFQIERHLRRSNGEQRKSAILKAPTVIFDGLLEVTDPTAFAQLLRNGIGRHRAFGHGLLLLRRAD